MEVVSLPFDVESNKRAIFMYGRPYSLSIERLAINFSEGSEYDEVSVYALTATSYWLNRSEASYTTKLALRAAGEASEIPSSNGDIACVFDLPSDITLDTLRTEIVPHLAQSYPVKLLSGFMTDYQAFPYLNITTEIKTEGSLSTRKDPVGSINDMVFIFSPLITHARGTDIDITYSPAPIVARANAQFSVLVQYVNKTTVNKRCKLTLYSRPSDPDIRLVLGAIFTPTPAGKVFDWPNGAPGGEFNIAASSTCANGAVYPPGIYDVNTGIVFDPYDYYGGVVDFDSYIWMVPFNAARKPIWQGINADIPSSEFFQYFSGHPDTEFAPVAAYRGGVLTKDGLIFLCPYAQASWTSGLWHYIDTNDFTVHSYPAPVIPDLVDPTLPTEPGGYADFPAYCGGALTSTGILVLAPFGASNRGTWHYVDTNTKVVHTYTVTYPTLVPLVYKYAHSSLRYGYVLFSPTGSDGSGYWHYFKTSTMTAEYYYSNLPASESPVGSYWSSSTVLVPGTFSYLIPFGQASRSRCHVIIHGDFPQAYIASTPVGLETEMFVKGILAPTGRLYLVPGFGSGREIWKYIEYPSSLSAAPVVRTYNTIITLFDDYTDGVMTFWGDIYLIPTFTSTRPPGRGTPFQVIRTYCSQFYDKSVVSCPEMNRM